MYAIRQPVFSNIDLENRRYDGNSTPKQVAESEGKTVHTYEDLLENVAEIAYRNPRLMILFRGQNRDYGHSDVERLNRSPKTSLRPKIFRRNTDDPNRYRSVPSPVQRNERFSILNGDTNHTGKVQYLRQALEVEPRSPLADYDEIAYAILQHYEACSTPLLDLTSNLSMAATFAVNGNVNDFGFVYVLGFTRMQHAVHFNPDERLVVVNLTSACPPVGLLPHYQEAFFAGPWPCDKNTTGNYSLDVRLVAKFKVSRSLFEESHMNPWSTHMLGPAGHYFNYWLIDQKIKEPNN